MYLPIMLNSFNHMAVYLHYLLATLGIRSFWAHYITWMQLLQFVVIFLQSLIAYKIGPTCGSPDFAKVLMIVYMGSMVALFIRYLVQRYILRRQLSTLDVCGVIKTPFHPGNSILAKTVQHCGAARLNDKGECHIKLPDYFPDPSLQVHPVTNSKRFTFGMSYLNAFHLFKVHVVYHLTPLNQPMPNLHIAHEVHRWGSNGETGTAHESSGKEVRPEESRLFSDKARSTENLLHPSDKKTVVTLSNGGALSKSKSYNNLHSTRHNDRVIDGPLPSLANLRSKILSAKKEGKENRSSPSKGSSDQGGRPPLCFSIAGGVPRGRVSWMVLTVPAEDGDEDQRRHPEDWRAIN